MAEVYPLLFRQFLVSLELNRRRHTLTFQRLESSAASILHTTFLHLDLPPNLLPSVLLLECTFVVRNRGRTPTHACG